MKDTRKYKLEGMRFERLEVLEYSFEKSKYLCKCDCGNNKYVSSGNLRNGYVKSCGCLPSGKEMDIIGKKFNMLTVVSLEGSENGKHLFKCVCDCGNEKILIGTRVKNGSIKSCGCLSIKKTIERSKTHGMRNTKLYGTWTRMRNRCNNVKNQNYNNYGGRGIKVCEEWNDFMNFYNWSMMNGYSNGLTIDRIDNDGNYEPSNCRWVTQEIQNRNKRGNLNFTYNNETKTLAEWCRELGLKYSPVLKRIQEFDYSFEKAITHNISRIRL